jgi:mevalonate pyrophosphate decarboxylase
VRGSNAHLIRPSPSASARVSSASAAASIVSTLSCFSSAPGATTFEKNSNSSSLSR